MTAIQLIPLAFSDRLLLDCLRNDISRILHATVEVTYSSINLNPAFNVSRHQYHSGMILEALLSSVPPNDNKLLAVTSYDLFIPVLTYVFGQAQYEGRTAIFSTFRLHNEFYGLPPSTQLLQQRATKEALHELGHTFGLRHCHDYPCVMNTSTYVEDIDLKPSEYCMNCMKQIFT